MYLRYIRAGNRCRQRSESHRADHLHKTRDDRESDLYCALSLAGEDYIFGDDMVAFLACTESFLLCTNSICCAASGLRQLENVMK